MGAAHKISRSPTGLGVAGRGLAGPASAMNTGDRVRGLLLIVVLLLLVRAGQYTYGWVAYRDERARLGVMSRHVADAGVIVVRSEVRADTLRTAIGRVDRELGALRRTLDRYGRYAHEGMIAAHLYDSYLADLQAYNKRVGERNALMEEWNTLLERNRGAVNRYNLLVDSIRNLAARTGDPYYPIPLPIEAAAERGLVEGMEN